MGFPARVATYFGAMFPPHVYLPLLALQFYGFYAIAQATRPGTVRIGSDSLFGLATVALSYLLLRLVDELKDEQVEPELFPDRPLVTGAVRYSDVRALALVALLAVVALNLGRGAATHLYFAWFALFVLSWQWWLFPARVAGSLWLTFVTHQPLVPLLFAYCYGVYLHTTGARPDLAQAAALCGAYWIPMFAWEIARKVRAPDEETAYPSYSRRWGTRRAASIPALSVLLAGAAMAAIGHGAGLSRGFALVHLGAAVAAAACIGGFLWRPRRGVLLVRTPVEAYLLVFYAAPLGDALARGELAWRS